MTVRSSTMTSFENACCFESSLDGPGGNDPVRLPAVVDCGGRATGAGAGGGAATGSGSEPGGGGSESETFCCAPLTDWRLRRGGAGCGSSGIGDGRA